MMNKNFAVINGATVDVTTVMDKTVQYTPSQEEVKNIKAEVEKLLEEYFDDVYKSGYGLRTMFDPEAIFWKQKGWIIDAFKKHPNYNGNLQIILRNQEMSRRFNVDDIVDFSIYVENWFDDNAIYESEDGRTMIGTKRNYYMKTISDLMYSDFVAWHSQEHIALSNAHYKLSDMHMDYTYQFVKRGIKYVLSHIEDECTSTVDKAIIERFTAFSNRYEVAFNMHEGEKITRLIGKLAKMVGLNKHVNIQDTSFTRQDGEVITRTKDLGWNYQFARFCDAVNPIIQRGTLVISVHPYDFYTMSFGKNWASCHTIDKTNKRHVGSHNYQGCYCGGTESYMLDNSSIIVYSLPENWEGEHPEYEDKIKRCVFYLGEDKLIQSRVYPDGRDGGDNSLAGDIRASVQKVISELFDTPNYWTNTQGTSACIDAIDTYGVHYTDYSNYDDCNVSFMKRIDGHKNHIRIRVGHNPICPECGEEHEKADNIFCDDCLNSEVECYECGDYHNIDDMRLINGHYYCEDCSIYCECCQEYRPSDEAEVIDGEVVCARCINDYYTWSDYHERYISDNYVIETEEGRVCEEDDGCYHVCAECGEYHNEELCTYDEETGNWYCDVCYEDLLAEREEIEEVEDEEE